MYNWDRWVLYMHKDNALCIRTYLVIIMLRSVIGSADTGDGAHVFGC